MTKIQPQAGPTNSHRLVNVNELKTLFANPNADIPIFYGDRTKDYVTPKFMNLWIKIARTTYHWSDKATAGNFKLSLKGRVIDWLNYIKGTKRIDVRHWSTIKPHIKAHYNVQVQTVDNMWSFSKLKQEEHDDPALEYCLVIRVEQITLEATQNLKKYLIKTLFTNKFEQTFKNCMLSQEPDMLSTATNTARAMWKRKFPIGQSLPKIKNVSIHVITSEIEGY
jgi:hypothetical protein